MRKWPRKREHVCPPPELQVLVGRKVAEVPGGLDDPAVVSGHLEVVDVELGADRPVGGFGLAGAFGGVLRDVGGEPGFGDLAVLVFQLGRGGRFDPADVDLGAPVQRQLGAVRVRGGHEHGPSSGVDGVFEQVRVRPPGSR